MYNNCKVHIGRMESYFCSSIEYRVWKVEYRVWKLEYRLDFSQRQWKSRVYLTFSLHFSPTRLFTTAMEKSSLPHFLTSLLSDLTFHNGSGKVESTSLSHFTSLRLDLSQRQWKSRVYLTFSLHFSPTRPFTTAMEKSSLPHFLTSLLSDSTL